MLILLIYYLTVNIFGSQSIIIISQTQKFLTIVIVSAPALVNSQNRYVYISDFVALRKL